MSGEQTPAPEHLDFLDQRDDRRWGDSRYRYDTTGAGATAYVIDSGVRATHSEFGGRVSGGWDFIDNDANPADCNGHGTFVASIIAGEINGVAKDMKIVPLRAFPCSGTGSWSDMIAAVDWVIQHRTGPAVINLSDTGSMSGTSATAPIVAGVVGRLLETEPHADPQRLAALVGSNAGHIDSDEYGQYKEVYANPGTFPSEPTSTRVTTDYGKRTATVTWDRPVSDGGLPITGYALTWGPPGWPSDVGGQVYFSSALSEPTSVAATVDAAKRTATLTWAPPESDGGSPITGYRVARDGNDAGGWGPWSTTVPASAPRTSS